MSFFKRNKRELIVAGVFIGATIVSAFVAPYLFPYFFAESIAAIAFTFGVSSFVAWLIPTAVAAAVMGVLGGLFTKAITLCCSPKADASQRGLPQDPLYQAPEYNDAPPSYGAGQQPGYLATNFAPPPRSDVSFVPAGDPLQTTTGETEGYLRTNTGEVVGLGFRSATGGYRPVWAPSSATATNPHQDGTVPVYHKPTTVKPQ